MRRRAVVFAGLVIALLASSWALRTRILGGPAPDGSAPRTLPSAERPQAAHLFAAGAESTYDVTYESEGAVSLGAQAGRQPPGTARLASKLHARLVRTIMADVANGHHVVLYRFVDAEVMLAVNESRPAAEASAVAASLARGVLVEHAAAGQVVSLRVEPSASPVARSFARSLVAWMQVTLPEKTTATWSARETDTNGAHTVGYALVVANDAARRDLAIRRTKAPSKPQEEQSEWLVTVRGESRVTGVAEIDFDVARGEVKELAGDETVQSMLGTLEIASNKETFEAERRSERTLDAAALAALTATLTDIAAAPATPLDAREQRSGDEARTLASKHWLGSSTLPQILSDLRASEGKRQDDRHFDLFLKLHAYSYLHPDECSRLALLLPSLDPAGSSFQTLAAALSATGSNEAQGALVGALHAPQAGAEAKKHIVAALGMLAFPSDSTEAALRSMRDGASTPELSGTAALALGIAARSLATRAPARADAIVDEALARTVAAEHDRPAFLLALAVLGNTASPRIVPDAVRWSHAADEAVRARAAFALRLVPTDDAEARLLSMLALEEGATVRSRVASALSFRDPTPASFEAQRARAAADPDAAIRAALLRNLFSMRASFPEAIRAVEERRQSDPDARVKQIAEGLLGSGDAGPGP